MSVVSPTWLRHDKLLKQCIPSVQEQGYLGEIEHLIVSDGPDRELHARLQAAFPLPPRVPIWYGELPEHGTGDAHYGNAARRHALENAHGELIAYLDDDDTYRPSHLELLAACFADPAIDFAYSNMKSGDATIGVDPPLYANIGTPMIMHRPGLLDVATWGEDSKCEDWELIRSWLISGAKYAYVPVITCDVDPGPDWRDQV